MKNRPIILLFLSLPSTLLAGNILDKAGYPSATPLVAFSLRQLSSTYTGNAIRTQRSSDGTSQDIGFTPAGDLDTAKLKAFVGSGDGYVTVWYDQSGNGYDASQGTAAIQPMIMSGGVINRDNGQPSVYTFGSNGFLSYGPISQLSGVTPVTRMEVARSRGGSLNITEGVGRYQLDLQLFPDKIWVQFETGNIVAAAAVSNTQTLMSINSVRNNGASQVYVNTALLGSTASSIMPFSAPVMGYIGVRFDYGNGATGPGAFSETILFNSVLSDADRQAINYNENWYYSLGFDPCSSTQASLSANGATTKALYACAQDGLWTNYYDPFHPLNLLFSIEKDPGNTGANPTWAADSINLTVTADPSTIYYSATSGAEGIFALGRYWNVYTSTPLASPVNVRFFYNPTDTLAARNAALNFKNNTGASTMSSLRWFKTVGNPFTPDSLTATPTAGIKGQTITLGPVYGTKDGVNYAEFDGITSFSGGTGVYIVSNTLTTLPVTIVSFTGRRGTGTTLLSWTTESESNSARFEIERSADGSDWLTIGQVAAAGNGQVTAAGNGQVAAAGNGQVAATGNSSTVLSYQFIDTVSLQGGSNLYYRLRLVNKDGTDSYSNVVLIQSSENAMAAPQLSRITPNPFESEMEITGSVPHSGPVEVLLRDMTGVMVVHQRYTASKGGNVWKLTNLDGLAKGVYVVRVLQEGATVGIGKVIKL